MRVCLACERFNAVKLAGGVQPQQAYVLDGVVELTRRVWVGRVQQCGF